MDFGFRSSEWMRRLLSVKARFLKEANVPSGAPHSSRWTHCCGSQNVDLVGSSLSVSQMGDQRRDNLSTVLPQGNLNQGPLLPNGITLLVRLSCAWHFYSQVGSWALDQRELWEGCQLPLCYHISQHPPNTEEPLIIIILLASSRQGKTRRKPFSL